MKKSWKNGIACIRYLMIMLLFSSNILAFAQNGNPFISNFKLPEGIDNQNWAIVQDRSGVMFFANRKGILTFDGLEWSFVNKIDIPYYLLYEPLTERVFAGCYDSYGYLTKNNFGNYDYHDISIEFSEVGAITQILSDDSYIYFYSDQTISKLSINDFADKKIWRSEENFPFTGMALLDNRIYVNIKDKGFSIIDGDSFRLLPGGDLIENDEIVFTLPFDENRILIATDNSFLYLFDGRELEDYIIKDEEYIMESVLSGGVLLNENEIALVTLTGGCLIVDKKTGETQYTLNYQTGLPDDEIYAIGKDQSDGLWLSHEFGTTRIDLSVPVWSYSSYPGLEGNLIAVLDFNNTVYVSTSEGVYYLDEVKDFKEIEILVKKKAPSDPVDVRKSKQKHPRRFKQIQLEPEIPEKPGEDIQEEEKKEGLLSRLFKRKEGEEQTTREGEVREAEEEQIPLSEVVEWDTAPAEETVQHEEPVSENVTVPVFTTKRTYALQSIRHKFSKIENLNDKCRQMVRFRDQLLVATNTGLYRIKDNEVKFIATYTYIHYIHASERTPGLFYIGTPEGAFTVNYQQGEWDVDRSFFPGNDPIYSILETPEGIWLGSETKAYLLNFTSGQQRDAKAYYFPDEYSERVMIRPGKNNTPLFLLSTGAYVYDRENDELVKEENILPIGIETHHYIFSEDGSTWTRKENNWIPIQDSTWKVEFLSNYLRLFDGMQYVYTDEQNNTWVIDGNNLLSKIEYSEEFSMDELFNVFFKSIHSMSGWNFTISRSQFTGSDFPLEFRITAPYYIRSDLTQYQYFLEGLNPVWSKWRTDPIIDFDYLPANEYTLHVRAKNILGTLSEEKTISFTIEPPFTKSVWFYFIIGTGAVLAVYLLIVIRERKLQRDKRILEQRVQERTAEIEKQKEEISKQRDEIEGQKQEITDSIHYAHRIQDAILPPDNILNSLLPEYFILFKPRDIVSGDFYWVAQKEERIFIAAADCTGHGVPGAFMSMLGYSFLNEIVNNYRISKPGQLLNRLRDNIINALHQTGKMDEAKDGMDIALCILNLKEKSIQFSGAYNPMFLVRKKKITEIKGDRMPIGIHIDEEKPFSNHELELKKGDTVYLFSDGYIDQFGGPKGGKFKLEPFKKLLIEIQDSPLTEQKNILDQRFEKWRGKYKQVDDILVIGFKV